MPIKPAAVAALTDVTVHTEHTTLGPWSLVIHPGELIALTGDNGAGKSSLLRVLCGLLVPSTGTVHPPTSRSLAPEPFHPPTGLRTRDMFDHVRQSLGAPVSPGDTALCSTDVMNSRLDTLSRGQLKRVVVAQAFIGPPILVLLDEPLEGLDRSGITAVTQQVHAHVNNGGCAVIATHRADAWSHEHTRTFAVGGT